MCLGGTNGGTRPKTKKPPNAVDDSYMIDFQALPSYSERLYICYLVEKAINLSNDTIDDYKAIVEFVRWYHNHRRR